MMFQLLLTTRKQSSQILSQFLGLGQMITTILFLQMAKALGVVSFPPFSRDIFFRIWPLPLCYFGKFKIDTQLKTKEIALSQAQDIHEHRKNRRF